MTLAEGVKAVIFTAYLCYLPFPVAYVVQWMAAPVAPILRGQPFIVQVAFLILCVAVGVLLWAGGVFAAIFGPDEVRERVQRERAERRAVRAAGTGEQSADSLQDEESDPA